MANIQYLTDFFSKQKAHIGYLTAGDGGIARSIEAALALIAGGVNILEIGIPFSDPIADGPVIEQAAQRALQQGTTFDDILYLIEKIRSQSAIPLILFSYLNPILAAMQTDFLAKASALGVNGLLIVDCPIEEITPLCHYTKAHDLAMIQLIAPSTKPARINKIAALGQGFIYYVSRAGTTGIRHTLAEDLITNITAIKPFIHLPIVVGFGICKYQDVKTILAHADGVVVGSKFVKAIADGLSAFELTQLAKSIFYDEALL
jgi:tryptophan synthase alpha chain